LLAGPAVCANGFTCDTGGGAYWIDGLDRPGAEPEATGMDPVDAAGEVPGAAAGERGSPAGVPQAVQNLRVPMSSALHFAQ